MNFLQKLLSSNVKTDPLGLEAILEGIRQLKSRVETEKQKLGAEKDKLRDAALADPQGELDEAPVLRRQVRVDTCEAALEKALDEASKQLNRRMSEIGDKIADMEKQESALRHRRDIELLKAIQNFIESTGARLTELPRLNHGGVIHVASLQATDDAEVAEFFKDSSSARPKATKTTQELDKIVSEKSRLELLRRFGGRKGLETLLGLAK